MKKIFILSLFIISNIPVFSQNDTVLSPEQENLISKNISKELSKVFNAYRKLSIGDTIPENFKFIEKKKDYLLVTFYRIRSFLVSAGGDQFYSDFKIKLPKGFVYQDVFALGDKFRFIYKNNQAIFIINQKAVKKYDRIDRFGNYIRADTIYLETSKDTIFVPTGNEIKEEFIRRMLRITNDKERKKCKKFADFADMVFDKLIYDDDYSKSKGRKDIMISKNNVKILLFNVKKKNIKKWSKLVQEIEVVPFDLEKFLDIFDKE